jgi:DNA-binding transcriptional LysR family regulator
MAASSMRGRATVGVVDNTTTDSSAPLHRAFARFNSRPHSVQVDMLIDGPQELQRRVIDRRLDLAICGFAPRLPELKYRPLHREEHGFYCGAAHPLFDLPGNAITLPEIRKHRIVERRYWRHHDTKRLGIAHAHATVDQMEAQLILIRSGAYLGFLPMHYAAS